MERRTRLHRAGLASCGRTLNFILSVIVASMEVEQKRNV